MTDHNASCCHFCDQMVHDSVTAALRVTLRDMTETNVAVVWDRAVPDEHASRTFQNVFAELVL